MTDKGFELGDPTLGAAFRRTTEQDQATRKLLMKHYVKGKPVRTEAERNLILVTDFGKKVEAAVTEEAKTRVKDRLPTNIPTADFGADRLMARVAVMDLLEAFDGQMPQPVGSAVL